MPPLVPPVGVGAAPPPVPADAAMPAVPVDVDGGAAAPALVPVPAVVAVAGGFTAPVPATEAEPGDPAVVVFGGVLPLAAFDVMGAEPVPADGGVTLVSDSAFVSVCKGVVSSPPQPAPSQSRALNTSGLRARVIMASLL
jgi:hypothetical protein